MFVVVVAFMTVEKTTDRRGEVRDKEIEVQQEAPGWRC